MTDQLAEYVELFRGLADRLSSLRTGGPVIGCDAEQIEHLRRIRGPHLPVAYEAFLMVMGQRAGVLWLGEDFFYSDTWHLATERDLVECARDWDVQLPEGNWTVFMDHQGYEFQWMQWQSPDECDPPVWRFLETIDPMVKRLASSFTQYVVDQVTVWERYVDEHPAFTFPPVDEALHMQASALADLVSSGGAPREVVEVCRRVAERGSDVVLRDSSRERMLSAWRAEGARSGTPSDDLVGQANLVEHLTRHRADRVRFAVVRDGRHWAFVVTDDSGQELIGSYSPRR